MSDYLQIPDGVDLYIDRVTRRCDALITSEIWNGLERNQLEYWLRSFKHTLEGRYFSALVLDSLIFRSKAQVEAMMVHGIQRLLPQLLRGNNSFSKYESKWLEIVRKSGVSVRIVPVIRKKDGPQKSGNSICRDYGNLLGVNGKIMTNPENIRRERNDGCNLFIFVDDFLGTGNQFKDFYDEVYPETDGATNVYLPLCAHEDGLLNVRKNCKELLVASSDVLGKGESFFKEKSELLPDGINKYDNLISLYRKYVVERMDVSDDGMFGYGGLALTYGFYNATPNSTISLLWSKKHKNTHLLVRN